MLVIYPIVGVNVFEPREEAANVDRLVLQGPHASGEGAETDDGFIVFQGALARVETVDSMPEWAIGIRQSLVDNEVLVADASDSSCLRLTKDFEFKSPSAAAAVLLGRSVAGPLEWKDASGKTLKEMREEAVSEEGPDVEHSSSVPPE
jgi:hypothetical protein